MIGRYPKTLLLAAVGACFLLSLLAPRLNPYHLDILITVGINVVLAVSLNLVNGYTGQFSLGHAGFMAVGAYLSAAFSMFIAPKFMPAAAGPFATALIFGLALGFGGIIAALAGLLVGAPSLRLKGDYLAIVTLGFGEIIRVIFRNTPALGGSLGLNGIPNYTTLFWIGLAVVITVYTVLAMIHSKHGRGFLAVHDDEIAAEASGINPTRYKIIAFLVGAFFAGVAGGLYAHFKSSLDPTGFGFNKSIEIVVMVILGGMASTPGVILAAILLTVLPEFLRPVQEYRMVIYSLLLIVLMLTRPQGLFNFKARNATVIPNA